MTPTSQDLESPANPGRFTTPLTKKAVAILRSLPSRGIGSVPVFPAADDPSKPSSRHAFQQWLKRAKQAWLQSIEDPAERERVRLALRGVGFHSEKRSGVRDPAFRQLPAAIQEEIAGTNYTTLRRIYDEITPEDIRAAWAEAR
jgi:integrase